MSLEKRMLQTALSEFFLKAKENWVFIKSETLVELDAIQEGLGVVSFSESDMNISGWNISYFCHWSYGRSRITFCFKPDGTTESYLEQSDSYDQRYYRWFGA